MIDEFKLNPGMSGYKEGDKWVYSYFVPHKPKILLTSPAAMSNFPPGWIRPLAIMLFLFDNETVFHLPYLFNQAGRPAINPKMVKGNYAATFSATAPAVYRVMMIWVQHQAGMYLAPWAFTRFARAGPIMLSARRF
jgi:putative alpha-1,2-mannosidase